jgi:hypothetical protein
MICSLDDYSRDALESLRRAAQDARACLTEDEDGIEPALEPIARSAYRVERHIAQHIEGVECDPASDEVVGLSVALAACRVEVMRLMRMERRLRDFVDCDPGLTDYKRRFGGDDLDAVLGTIDELREEIALLARQHDQLAHSIELAEGQR